MEPAAPPPRRATAGTPSSSDASFKPRGAAWNPGVLGVAGLGSAAAAVVLGLTATAALTALKHFRDGTGFNFLPCLRLASFPRSFTQAVDLIGALAFGVVLGVAVPALRACRCAGRDRPRTFRTADAAPRTAGP